MTAQNGRTGDRNGHHDDGTEWDEEHEIARETETDGLRAACPKCRTPLGERLSPGFESGAREFDREEPAAHECAQARRDDRANHGNEPERDKPSAGENRRHEHPETVAYPT